MCFRLHSQLDFKRQESKGYVDCVFLLTRPVSRTQYIKKKLLKKGREGGVKRREEEKKKEREKN